MPKKSSPSTINQTAIGDGNVQVAGDGNTVNVNQTIIQKIFNIFKSDAETVDQRNRRIMLGHVEHFWVKGILEKSLHGAALLDLGIKEDPGALNYPWAIKREANKEILPVGKSMLEIFQDIGMGRSLLILGAPGSGKTTMLLELTRQLIEHAHQDVTEPIPVVFNLSSWTEKLNLADWLARELNVIYTIPKKIAPSWVTENKMMLLLDGLDEVKHESRDKCVDAINQFRNENGLTSMAVCSRVQDYAELKTRLSFEGAVEIQPLTSNQVDEYFNRFGDGLAGIRQVLEKDTVLREMGETPLFLSIMTLAYHDTQGKDILVSNILDVQRKYLFDTYIERMFERPRSKNALIKKQQVVHWLSWLAQKMVEYNAVPYLLEEMQPRWLGTKQGGWYKFIQGLGIGLIIGVIYALIIGAIYGLNYGLLVGLNYGLLLGLICGLLLNSRLSDDLVAAIIMLSSIFTITLPIMTIIDNEPFERFERPIDMLLLLLFAALISGLFALFFGLFIGLMEKRFGKQPSRPDVGNSEESRLFTANIKTVEALKWNWNTVRQKEPFVIPVIFISLLSLIGGIGLGLSMGLGIGIGLFSWLASGLENRSIDQTTYPGLLYRTNRSKNQS